MAATAVWRIGDATSFRRLREEGRRSRTGPLRVVFVPPTEVERRMPPRVAYAVGRAIGGAVVRNRVRRRLRAIVRRLSLAPGLYLVVASPAVAGFDSRELERALRAAIADACSRVEVASP